jgi:hypothetical protein
VDVFESNVPHPHAKEDFLTAYNRCRTYVRTGVCVSPILYNTVTTDEMTSLRNIRFAIPHERMAQSGDKINCTFNSVSYFNKNGGDPVTLEIASIMYPPKNAGNEIVEFETQMDPTETVDATALRVNYTLSCECMDK